MACVDGQGRECARGLINYSSADTRRILRQPSSQIARILGSRLLPSRSSACTAPSSSTTRPRRRR
ncbi:hypothetical protein [Xylella fastidiosa]|uniref:hypothetical protein n=1 Tax=Xylella fastidiosa TaxID=2371 RepID=UPI003CCF285C